MESELFGPEKGAFTGCRLTEGHGELKSATYDSRPSGLTKQRYTMLQGCSSLESHSEFSFAGDVIPAFEVRAPRQRVAALARAATAIKWPELFSFSWWPAKDQVW